MAQLTVTTFLDKELNVLKKIAYDMLRLDFLKPQFVNHEIKAGWDPKKEKTAVKSQCYSNRMPQSASVSITTYSDAFSVTFLIYRKL